MGAARPRGFYLGLDLGGTQVKAARFSAAGEREATARADSPSQESAEAILGAVQEAARVLLTGGTLLGVGIGAAGVIDAQAGRIVQSPNLPPLAGFPLRERLREALGGITPHLMNDANAAALGEFHAGAGRGFRSMVLLTLGTGIGGGIVLDGKLWEGAAGVAGEVGHMCIQAGGPECTCGARGCLEACVSGWALARDAQAAAREPGSALASLPEFTPKRLADLALAGDAGALALWEKAGTMLGTGIANLMNLLNPECVILVGGLAQAGELLLAPARRAWERQALGRARASARVRMGALGEWAGARGAVQPLLAGP